MAVSERQSVKPGGRFFYGYVVVFCSLLITVATLSAHNSIGVFFKPLLEQFQWSRASLSGAVSLGLIVNGVLAIVMGGLTHKIGPRIITTIAGVAGGAGYILMSQVSAIWQVYIFFGLLLGINMGGQWVPLLTTIARWFVKRRGMMTGIVVTSTGIGPLLGPLVTSWLLSNYSWQTSYIIIGSVVLVVIVLSAQFLRFDPARMGLFPDGEPQTDKQDLHSATHGFSFQEALHTRQYWALTGMFFCMGFFYFSILVHIIPHATDLGFSTVNAAGILAVSGVLTIAGNLFMGIISDKVGIRRIIIISYILAAVSLFLLLVAKELWILYLFGAILGFGWGGFSTLESPATAWLFGMKSHGLIFATFIFSMAVGSSAGPYLTGYIFDKTGSYQYDFIIFVALSVIGVILTFTLRPTAKLKP